MRNCPVDMNRMQLIGTGKTAERAEYVETADGNKRRSGNQARLIGPDGKPGAPLFVVDCLLNDPEAERADIVSVKVACYEVPTTTFGTPVRFVNLVASPYVARDSGRISWSFSADAMEGAGQIQRSADKGAAA